MDWNWLEVICTQVICVDMSDWMCGVYFKIKNYANLFLCGVCLINITW